MTISLTLLEEKLGGDVVWIGHSLRLTLCDKNATIEVGYKILLHLFIGCGFVYFLTFFTKEPTWGWKDWTDLIKKYKKSLCSELKKENNTALFSR